MHRFALDRVGSLENTLRIDSVINVLIFTTTELRHVMLSAKMFQGGKKHLRV